MDSKLDWFDFCNSDTWSLLYVEEFLEILECNLRAYWCELGKTVADGLRTLRDDSDIIEMINVSATCKNFLSSLEIMIPVVQLA